MASERDVSVLQKFNVTVIGDGPRTIVLAHGFGSDQTAWRYQVAALAEGGDCRIVLFDYLGCGRADASGYSPLHYDSFDRYVDDVLAIYEALGLRDTIFVGHSASGMIGLLASVARPELFRELVLVGASPRYLNEGDYVGGFERADLDALYAAMANDYLGWANGFAPVVMGNQDKPALGQEFARTLSSMRPDIAQSVARLLFDSDLRDRLPAVQAPVLVLQAKNDIAVPVQVGEYLSTHLARCRMILLNAQGHLPHLSAPDEVTAALRQVVAHAAV